MKKQLKHIFTKSVSMALSAAMLASTCPAPVLADTPTSDTVSQNSLSNDFTMLCLEELLALNLENLTDDELNETLMQADLESLYLYLQTLDKEDLDRVLSLEYFTMPICLEDGMEMSFYEYLEKEYKNGSLKAQGKQEVYLTGAENKTLFVMTAQMDDTYTYVNSASIPAFNYTFQNVAGGSAYSSGGNGFTLKIPNGYLVYGTATNNGQAVMVVSSGKAATANISYSGNINSLPIRFVIDPIKYYVIHYNYNNSSVYKEKTLYTYGAYAVPAGTPTRPASYSVTFNQANNGAALVKSNSYTFTGWSGLTYPADYQDSTTITRTAQFSDNGVVTPSMNKNGYTFNGWADAGGVLVAGANVSYKPNANITLNPKFTPTPYGITYNLNGGTASNPVNYTIESSNFTLNNPTKEHYDFTGWSGTGLSGSANKSVSIPKGSTGARAYTANWAAHPYTITYTDCAKDNETYTIESTTFEIQPPVKAGYTFTGWTGANGNTPQTVVTISKGTTGNKTYRANWRANTYKVTYNANSGQGNMTQSDHVYDQQKNLRKNSFTKTGYTFGGWKTAQDADSTDFSDTAAVVNLTDQDNGNVDLYAHWDANTYTVKYDLQGGRGTADTVHAVYDTEFTTAPAPERTGYDFTSWIGDGNDVYDADVNVKNLTTEDKASVILKAGWQAHSYVIKYDVNGGDNPIPDATATYDQSFQMPTPTKAGFQFLGWTDGNKTYQGGENVSNLTSVDNGQVTLKAQWNKNNAAVDNNDGKGNSASKEDVVHILEVLRSITKTSDLIQEQLTAIQELLSAEYLISTQQSQKLIDLIKNTTSLTEEQKIELLRALTSGTMTDTQKQLLKTLISKSGLSGADKKALLSAISGISSLTEEKQKQLIDALNSGSAADITLENATYEIVKTGNGTLQIAIKSLSGGDVTIPDSITVAGKTYPITRIADNAFKGKDVKSVTMGDNISEIGTSAFEGCNHLTTVTMGQGVLTINDKAFKNCTALGKTIDIPASVKTIGNSAFEGCIKLQKVNIADGSKLLEIGVKAFYSTGLTSFTLPKSVIKVGDSAFAGNKTLKTFKFQSGSELVTIGKSIWEKDTALTKISLPSKLTSIPVKSFKGDKALKTVKIGSAVTSIGTSAFEGCKSIKLISIPSKVMTIGKKAFYGANKLKTVSFKGKALQKAGSKAFKKCHKKLKFKCPKKKLSAYKKILKGKY